MSKESQNNIHEIRVSPVDDDPYSRAVEQRAKSMLSEEIKLESAKTIYLEGVNNDEAARLKNELLVEPVTQQADMRPRSDWDNPNVIEVDPQPGVMNTDIDALRRGSELLGIKPKHIQTGVEHRFLEVTDHEAVAHVTGKMLVNQTVDFVRRESPSTFEISSIVPQIEKIDVDKLSDNELEALSKNRKLALNLSEMKAIRDEAQRLGRQLTDGELEYLGGAWSEHCRHKTFNAEIIVDGEKHPPLFKRIKDGSTPYFEEREVLSAFHDNSGVFRFYDGKAICVKLETHNSPMNLEPFGGAATGSGGVFRDIVATGRGAKVINSQHMQFLAPLGLSEQDVPPGCHPPAYLLTRSVDGVRDYGNKMGIPTNNGSFHTHPNYRGKGSILVGASGILPENRAEKGEPMTGDLVIAAGGRTGRDGIHGATFSSESADSGTATLHSGAVQIGDPITEKKVFDAIEEAADRGLIRALTDCGAAGFASAVGEMGEDIGVRIDLSRAPLKYQGLAPWEIFVSESQERMVLAVDPQHEAEIMKIFKKYGSEATVLGVFGSEGDTAKLEVYYGVDQLVDLDYDFIKEGMPNEPLHAEWSVGEIEGSLPTRNIYWQDVLSRVLANGNICSKEPIVRQYDHEVQGTSANKPYSGVSGEGPSDGAIMTPILGKKYTYIEAHGTNPTLSDIDPKWGSVWAFTEAISNFVACGGNPDDVTLLNNYISATPNKRVLGALHESVNALMECVREFRAPIISGKDSLSSTFKFDSGEILESPYNLTITAAGKIKDVEKTLSSDIKRAGSTLVLLGTQDTERMGGSVYYDEQGGHSNQVPRVDIKKFHTTATGLYQAIQTGKILSAHDVSEGGVATTISEMLFGSEQGAEISLENDVDEINFMFNETAGCFVVEVENEQAAEELFSGLEYKIIGKTTEKPIFHIMTKDKSGRTFHRAFMTVKALKKAWKEPMERIFS